MIRKVTQEVAFTEMIGDALARLDAHLAMGYELKRVEELQRELNGL